MNRQNLLIISFFLFFLIQSSSLWAEVTASTGRTVLSIDETIALEIKSSNGSGTPDLSVLQDDFQILSRSKSQSYSMINGRSSSTHSWNINLLPKRTGEITIPAIQVGNETTQAIHLVIQKTSTTPGLDGKEVFLKITVSANKQPDADASNNDFYVQQQILVNIQLFHRIRFTNATLTNLELNNTVVEKLGNDSTYSKTISNHRYNVVEQHYAIYPQQSGTLTIPALIFSANAEISQKFSLFSRPGKQIISRTKPVTLNILPVPANYTGKNWLPAENLVIESRILEDVNSIIAGEAITRHIVVRATGLLSSQLPAFSVPSSNTIKTYPDKEKLTTQMQNGKVVGSRRDTVAIIPLAPGRFTLPEMKIDWWNTRTNQQESAILPARTLMAQENPEQTANQSKTLSPDTEIQSQKNAASKRDNSPADMKKTPENIIEKIVYKESNISKNPWFWISLALLIFWLVTLALLFLVAAKKKRPAAETSAKENSRHEKKDHKKYLQLLYDRCQENDASKATRAIVIWAKYYFNQPMLSGLSQIIELIDDEHLIDAINHLEKSQYSVDKESWNGGPLSTAVTNFIKQNEAHRRSVQQGKNQDFALLNP